MHEYRMIGGGRALALMVVAACGRPAATGTPVASPRSRAEGALALQMVNIDEVRFPAQEPDTPPTMRIATLEGTFPFGPEKAYTALIEFDPGVEVPVHHHPTTERVTILAGDVQFGTGPESDRSKAKALAAGAVIITPAGTPHWGFIPGAKALLFIHGVGPHNDPRAVDPAAAAPAAPRFDSPLAAAVILNPAEVRFAPVRAGTRLPYADRGVWSRFAPNQRAFARLDAIDYHDLGDVAIEGVGVFFEARDLLVLSRTADGVEVDRQSAVASLPGQASNGLASFSIVIGEPYDDAGNPRPVVPRDGDILALDRVDPSEVSHRLGCFEYCNDLAGTGSCTPRTVACPSP